MKKILLACLVALPFFSIAQNLQQGQIHGNFQTDIQFYQEDEKIGAAEVPETMLMNSFANVIYTNGNFEAGARYESYLNALQGYDERYKGNGIPHRYATYRADDFSFTVGSFYEQFGNGLVFRSYEERSLGYDNAMDGIRVKASPFKGVTLKGIYGKQRLFFDKSDGIVRGADGEVFVNDLFPSMEESKTKVFIGGSVVSKYQKDDDPDFELPENVAAFAGRMNVIRGKINLLGEYAYKINDPSALNNGIYKDGEALFVSAGYSQKGLGFTLSGKRIDNMYFRSDRMEIGNALDINYLPALTQQHHYTLTSMYPYATQANGEMGLQAELIYKFKKKTALGGKYGTTLQINYSRINDIKRDLITDSVNNRYLEGYESDFFAIGDDLFFEDINVKIKKKISKKVKMVLEYMYQCYNQEVIAGHPDEPKIYANIGVADVTYKFNHKHALRAEAQYLQTDQENGDWMLGLLEYTVAPKWFITVMDQYNSGNEVKDKQIHYYTGSLAFVHKAHRIALSYGKQREGILCVGGVCRVVPASNGMMLTITSSF